MRILAILFTTLFLTGCPDNDTSTVEDVTVEATDAAGQTADTTTDAAGQAADTTETDAAGQAADTTETD